LIPASLNPLTMVFAASRGLTNEFPCPWNSAYPLNIKYLLLQPWDDSLTLFLSANC
jgi:hypothetical protein